MPARARARTLALALTTGLSLVLPAASARAQDMEPRSYANTPVGINMIGLGYTYSWGAVLVDPSLPVEGLDAKLNALAPFYVRTASILGWASKLVLTWPGVHLSGEGEVENMPVSGTRQGVADPRVRLNVNFLGAPATELREFMKYRQGTIVGATFEIQAPLGTYDTTKFVNPGANRWTFMVEGGVSQRIRRWTLEGSAGALLFTANNEYLGSSTLEQNPVTYADLHVIYNLRPAIWLSVDALWVWGGQTSLDGVQRADLQTNTRAGLTLSFPIARRHSLKFLYANGVTTRFGADFKSFGISWLMSWGG